MPVHEYVGTLYVQTCIKCGIAFGVPNDYDDRRRTTHENFFCPNGHSQFYPQASVEEQLRKERDNAVSRATQLTGLLEDERMQHRRTEMRLRATKGVVVRTKKRIAQGACPRCHKRFPDLKAHMHDEHPDYAPA